MPQPPNDIKSDTQFHPPPKILHEKSTGCLTSKNISLIMSIFIVGSVLIVAIIKGMNDGFLLLLLATLAALAGVQISGLDLGRKRP